MNQATEIFEKHWLKATGKPLDEMTKKHMGYAIDAINEALLLRNNAMPNGIDLLKLKRLLVFSDKYEISIQFWPGHIAVFIAKDGVDLTDFGGDFDFAISESIEYLVRINGGENVDAEVESDSGSVCTYCKDKKKIFHWEFGQFVECRCCQTDR